jgi:hypothetical protein
MEDGRCKIKDRRSTELIQVFYSELRTHHSELYSSAYSFSNQFNDIQPENGAWHLFYEINSFGRRGGLPYKRSTFGFLVCLVNQIKPFVMPRGHPQLMEMIAKNESHEW